MGQEDNAFTENFGTEQQADVNVDQATTQPQGDNDSLQGDEKVLGEETKDQQVADAQKQHDNDGTWPEDTPQWVKDRVNKTTRQKHEARQEAERLRHENEELRKKLEADANKPKPVGPKPNKEDFKDADGFPDTDAYFDALADWKFDKREEERRLADQAKQTKVQEAEKAKTKASTDKEKMDAMFDAGEKKHADFVDKVLNVPPAIFNPAVADAIMATDNNDDVAYWLANNLPEAEKIANLGSAAMAVQIGKISARLAAKPTKTTNAPDPVKTVQSRGGAKTDPSKMSDDEWFEQRRQEQLKRRMAV